MIDSDGSPSRRSTVHSCMLNERTVPPLGVSLPANPTTAAAAAAAAQHPPVGRISHRAMLGAFLSLCHRTPQLSSPASWHTAARRRVFILYFLSGITELASAVHSGARKSSVCDTLLRLYQHQSSVLPASGRSLSIS